LLLHHRRSSGRLEARFGRAWDRRVSAAVAALAFVFASLLGMVHDATTSHVRCAEHGELVDSDRLPATSALAGPARDTIASAQRSARGLGDVHCLLASALRQSRIAPRLPTLAAAIVQIAELATAPPPAAHATSTGLYRIAPKTSPPA
jgi:predicted phage tail protein